MSEEQVIAIESAADAATQARAEQMGWIPPARYKGEADRFVDAEAYIERGEVVVPILKANLKKTEAKLAELTRNQTETAQALEKANKALEEINLRNSVATQKAVERAKAEVKAELAKASEAGDHEAVAELTEQMVELNQAPPPKETKAAEPPAPRAPAVDPVVSAWVAGGNEWFGKDRRKTALMMAIVSEWKEAGDARTGAELLNAAKIEMLRERGEVERSQQVDKVGEGGRNGSEGEARSNGRKSYNALPADAKRACDDFVREFVGPKKQYKDAAAARQGYADLYFEQGA